VIELRFDRALYAGPSIDEAAKVYAGYAELALSELPEAWVVRVSGDRHVEVARELANYALGATIRARGQALP